VTPDVNGWTVNGVCLTSEKESEATLPYASVASRAARYRLLVCPGVALAPARRERCLAGPGHGPAAAGDELIWPQTAAPSEDRLLLDRDSCRTISS
jgi:hypothetical protein